MFSSHISKFLLPAEAEEDGEDREEHDGGVGDVRQEDGQLGDVELSAVDEDKEENETDEGGDEDQETKEESLAGPDTVDPGVGDHLPGGDGQAVQLVIAPEPTKPDVRQS